jgi:hypothetical protein
MRNQWILVGILAGALTASPAFAQHKAPNEQPKTDAAPAAPTGELVLGSVHLAKPMTADGKPLPAGHLPGEVDRAGVEARREGGERKPRALGRVLAERGGQGREVVSIVPQAEVKNVVKDAPPPAGGAPKVQTLKGQRVRAGVVQQRRQPLSDLLPDGRLGEAVRKRLRAQGSGLRTSVHEP